jgi:hypothetical protein
MKKLFVILMAISVFFIIGCGKDSPEGDASEYIEKSLAFDKNIKLDTSGLKYKVGEEVEGKTIVTVSGKIKCDGKIVFVKKEGEWVLTE